MIFQSDISEYIGRSRVSATNHPRRRGVLALVRFIRYYGTEEKVGREMNVIKDVTFEGRILEQIRRAVDYLETQVKEHSYLGESGHFLRHCEEDSAGRGNLIAVFSPLNSSYICKVINCVICT